MSETQIIGGVPVHAMAKIFPMVEKDFAELKADVAANGLIVPITKMGEYIIDGRHRARACDELGIEPAYTTFDGDEEAAWRFVVSANVKRRHLTESQRSMAAARLANMRQGERTDLQPCDSSHKVSQSEAAQKFGVSRELVNKAAKVIRECEPEIIAAVDAGTLSVSAAVEIAIASKAAGLSIVSQLQEFHLLIPKVADLDEIEQLEDQGEKLKAYATALTLIEEIQRHMTIFTLHATRGLGEISAALPKAKSRHEVTLPSGGSVKPVTKTETLREHGIDIRRANEAGTPSRSTTTA